MNKIVLLTFFSAFLTQSFAQVKVANNVSTTFTVE